MSQSGEMSTFGRSRRWVGSLTLGAVVMVALVLGVVWRVSDGPGPGAMAPSGPTSGGVDLDSESLQAVQHQQAALAAHDRATFLGGWAQRPTSLRLARSIYANLADLHARVDLRFVDSSPGTAASSERLGGPSWTADVDVAWRLVPFDTGDAATTLSYTFVSVDGEAQVVGVDVAEGANEPIWLADPLVVRRSADTLVTASNVRDAREVSHRLRVAYRDVTQVIGPFRGGLVAYLPASTTQLEAIIGAGPGDYDTIAAVTTSVDSSRAPTAPVAIVINPDAYAELGPIGRHVVISHESTHLATGAAVVSMPTWVAEGFADYVGVGSVDVPIRVSAGVLIADIRRHGLPDELPSNADFSTGRADLESAYEASWLAARLIATEVGEPRLVAFYEAVVAHPTRLNQALRREVGMTLVSFTRAWRLDLQELPNGS